VQLTTIFRAKGCEYQQVHLPFWDKDAFPYMNKSSGSIGADIEEERRLAYVGMTRAKQQACIYYSAPEKPSPKVTNASRFVMESKIKVAQELGPKLYSEGELPFYRSPVVEEYCRRLGRAEDVVIPKTSIYSEAHSIADENYSYKWALMQPLPENAEKVISAMIRTKTAKYLDTEISRIIRELKAATKTKKKVLVNRLIVTSNARSRVRR
ncbi:3'-5' exonuclease, partial [Photobacterium sanctipauli]